MQEDVTYFAVVGDFETKDDPNGLLRRRITDPKGTPGLIDERLDLRLKWVPTDQISRYFLRGSNDMYDLEEITEEEAKALIERLRRERNSG